MKDSYKYYQQKLAKKKKIVTECEMVTGVISNSLDVLNIY